MHKHKVSKFLVFTLLAVLVTNACSPNPEKQKTRLQKDYIRSIIGSKCAQAETAYNEMLKMDPQDTMPMLTYTENLKALNEQLAKDVLQASQEAQEELEDIQQHRKTHRNFINRKAYDYYHAGDQAEATEDMREALSSYEDAKYANKQPIPYARLKTSIDACKAGNKAQVPVADFRKALELINQ